MKQYSKELLIKLETEALNIRRNVWRALYAAGSGHVGGSCSAADLLAVLYFYYMKYRADKPDWEERDRFILSKGHANAALAAVLARAGFFSESLLDDFYSYRSLMGMHPDIKLAGVEMSTGGLGHGLSIGVGMALGQRLQGQTAKTFVLLGDGEIQEGSNWEAAMAGSNLNLANLVGIIDFNKIQQSARVEHVMRVEPLVEKWVSFGWSVKEINGHKITDIISGFDELPYSTSQPSLIIAHTVKGKGVSFAENTYEWHQNIIDKETYQRALAELGEKPRC